MSHAERVGRLRERLPQLEVDAFLVTGLVNVRYLTGFQSTNAALLVDGERTIMLTDGRYAEAGRSVPGVELVLAERELPSDLRSRLAAFSPGPVGFEADHLSFHEYATVAESGVELSATRRVVEALRGVKDETELDAVRRSAAILNDAFERLAVETVVGRTEAELAWWIERTLRELGAEAVSFHPIVASGPNAALPHHHPGARVLGPRETLVVDAGCVVDGYCSDCTRTFATGALAEELELAYAVCLEVQLASLEALRAGAACRDVDAVARQRLQQAGYQVLHNLGHSVGLEIHEDPRLAKNSDDVVAVGNVLTVEPGIYLAGLGGTRIEDLVIAGEGAPEILTPVTKELVRLA
jgi:Xaa-Pro aminopeptidase